MRSVFLNRVYNTICMRKLSTAIAIGWLKTVTASASAIMDRGHKKRRSNERLNQTL